MSSTLIRILEILASATARDITQRFVDLLEVAIRNLSENDQQVAQAALADARLDSDEAHARLQARLAQARNG